MATTAPQAAPAAATALSSRLPRSRPLHGQFDAGIDAAGLQIYVQIWHDLKGRFQAEHDVRGQQTAQEGRQNLAVVELGFVADHEQGLAPLEALLQDRRG